MLSYWWTTESINASVDFAETACCVYGNEHYRFYKRMKITSPAERHLASKEGFWCKEWDNRFRGRNW